MITVEEVTQAMFNLVKERDSVIEYAKQLEAKIKELTAVPDPPKPNV